MVGYGLTVKRWHYRLAAGHVLSFLHEDKGPLADQRRNNRSTRTRVKDIGWCREDRPNVRLVREEHARRKANRAHSKTTALHTLAPLQVTVRPPPEQISLHGEGSLEVGDDDTLAEKPGGGKD